MAKAERGESVTPVPNHPLEAAEPMRDTRMNNQRVLMSEFEADRQADRERGRRLSVPRTR